jgi:hypothetical protein
MRQYRLKKSIWENVGVAHLSADVFGKFETALIYDLGVIQELK